jgi:hypothetical protein
MLSKFFKPKNFSIFSKIKDYVKSDSQAKAGIFSAGQFDVENIKIEYEDEELPKKVLEKINKGLTDKSKAPQFTEEELKILSEQSSQIIRMH